MSKSEMALTAFPPPHTTTHACTPPLITPGNDQPPDSSSSATVCHKCQYAITDPHLLVADNHYWHEDCLRCSCCDARLAELDKFCYVKANMALCKRDYLRLYGSTGLCAVCQKNIQAFEYVMRARTNVYHLDCFSCQRCHLRFCVGDKYYLHENRILCELDYEDALSQQLWCRVPSTFCLPLSASKGNSALSHPDPVGQRGGYDALAQLKAQTNSLIKMDDSSSGYGSPSPTASAAV